MLTELRGRTKTYILLLCIVYTIKVWTMHGMKEVSNAERTEGRETTG